MIKRIAKNEIEKVLGKNKTIIILGPRQVGKTTLVEDIMENKKNVIWFNGDDVLDQELFIKVNKENFKPIIGNNKYLIIDEAQRIPDIGIKLKILYDNFKNKVQIIATGSSSFELANKINEPLTGRKRTIKMFPLTYSEMIDYHGLNTERRKLNNRLLYGFYPEIITDESEAKKNLIGLTNDNLYKDIYKWENLKKPIEFQKLVKALAYQIGQLINYSELARFTGLDKNTVTRYISLLERSYIIFRLGSFSNNLRNELKKSEKIYFYDTGIRNALISEFKPIEERSDIGNLFENFVIAEFAKKYMPDAVGDFGYFWRTKSGQEIDFILQKGSDINAYEIKWSSNAKVKIPKTFLEKYSPKKTVIINKDNYYEYF